MLVGKIYGKVTTTEFRFIVEREVTKFDYVQVYHDVYDYVLCQVIELEKQESMTTAQCHIIGYKDKDDRKIKKLRIPFEPGSEVFLAQDDFIREVVKLESKDHGAYLGKLDGKDIPIYLDLRKLLTKHVAILAKSGSGKSYTVGVLLEEIIDKNVPLLIIDPHGEYSSMKHENTEESEISQMAYFDVRPERFNVNEYGDPNISKQVRPLKLTNKISSQELVEMLPTKLSSTQLGLLHSATQHLDACDFDSVLSSLHQEESNAKWNVISIIEQLRGMNLFSDAPTPYHELVSSGTCSVLNLKGIDPEIQDIIVYKLTKDLFDARKKNTIPPFFLVVEEAHNYCPERSFGEKKSSKVLRTIASEGRKFGLGLGVVSQRPARVDKSVLSQCSTQLIMKVTNPNDIKAISNSVEGLTASTEKEMQEISIGTSLVTGVTEVPLFVRVRPRKSLHGGQAIDILGQNPMSDEGGSDIFEQIEQFENEEVLPVIKPTADPKDLKLMSDKEVKEIRTILVPAYQLTCTEGESSYQLLIDRTDGGIIVDKETASVKQVPQLSTLSQQELMVLQTIYSKKEMTLGELQTVLQSLEGIEHIVKSLLQKGYLAERNDSYFLNPNIIFDKLSTCKTHDEINYESIPYHEKKEPRKELYEIKQSLSQYTSIQDYAECFLLTYEVIYVDDETPDNNN
ncbi:MAG: ATP-binding protein [Candidatus Woesearchaeota archaeon]